MTSTPVPPVQPQTPRPKRFRILILIFLLVCALAVANFLVAGSGSSPVFDKMAAMVETATGWASRTVSRIWVGQETFDSRLHIGVLNHDAAEAAAALDLGADPNFRKKDALPVLAIAVYENNRRIASLLIDAGADINFITPKGWPLLSIPIKKGHNAMAHMLIDRGADIHIIPPKLRQSPLWSAVRYGNDDILERLLSMQVNTPMVDARISASYRKKPSKSLFRYALHKRQHRAAELLVTGVNGTRIPDAYLDASPYISNGCLVGVQRALTKRKYENFKVSAANPLITAIRTGEPLDRIEARIRLSPGLLNRQEQTGDTPLTAAIESGRADLVQSLITLGADIELADADGFSPLAIAASRREYDIFRLLIQAGANLATDVCQGRDTFFSYIIESNDITAMRVLKEEHVALNQQVYQTNLLRDSMGFGEKRRGISELLLEAGADPYYQDRVPYFGARYIKETDCFKELTSFLPAAYPSFDLVDQAINRTTPLFDPGKSAPVLTHVISVYKGTNPNGYSRIPVEVTDTRRPVNLVLNSHTPVEWQIQAGPGVILNKIWAFGRQAPRVSCPAHLLAPEAIEVRTDADVRIHAVESVDQMMDLMAVLEKQLGVQPASCQSEYNGQHYTVDGRSTHDFRYRIADAPPAQPVVLTPAGFKATLTGDQMAVAYGGAGGASEAMATHAYNAGKWYFEAVVHKSPNRSKAGSHTDIGLFYHHADSKSFRVRDGLARMHRLGLRQHTRKTLPHDRVIGVAMNLDDGKLYFRLGGRWINGDPTRWQDGISLQKGRTYTAGVRVSGQSAGAWSDEIRVNFGKSKFSAPIPPGYLSYDGYQRGPVAPSFNCANADTEIEKCICRDPHLSRLDTGLNRVYAHSLRVQSLRGRDQLKAEQRAWVTNRDRISSHLEKEPLRRSLAAIYEKRIDELLRHYTKGEATSE